MAVVAAIVLSACASLAAFETLSVEYGAAGSAEAVARGSTLGIGPLNLTRLDSVSDAARLVRSARGRSPRWTALGGIGLCLILAAASRIALAGGQGWWRRTLLATASSRAPPRTAMTLS